jgi:transcriptional regulator with XRE-family HTH domain
MIASTLPLGIGSRQYPRVIYPAVYGNDNSPMGREEREEHWRQRLLELKNDLHLKQSAMAQAMNVDASYFSRLLYPPGKKGRKNLGLDTMLACREAFHLSADWFDLPLGTALPSGQRSLEAPRATALTDAASVVPISSSSVTWPFKQVTYRRLTALRSALGTKLGAEAIREIDELLDVVVTKWERLASKKKNTARQ